MTSEKTDTQRQSILEISYSCPICDSEKIKPFAESFWRGDRPLLDMLEIDYVPSSWSHCQGCNHVFLNPRLSTQIEQRLYGEESIYRRYSIGERTEMGYLAELDPTILDSGVVHSSHLSRLERIKVNLDTSIETFVDFGSGFGSAHSAVKSMGWNYLGIERDPWCIKHGRAFGRVILEEYPRSTPLDHEGAGLIYSSQVFEHIKHPNEVMPQIISMLKPEGYFFIDVPTHSFQLTKFNTMGRGGLICMNWGHYHSYTAESLQTLLNKWGFSVVDLWLSNGDLNALSKRGLQKIITGSEKGIKKYSTKKEKTKFYILRRYLMPLREFYILLRSAIYRLLPKPIKRKVKRLLCR